MGYQSDKQLGAYIADVARKKRERRFQGYERAKSRNLWVGHALVIAFVVILISYFAARIR
jgi:hypothetical protein